jgi:hypothetical protein
MIPRIRSIKPEVHLDEELWDLEEQSGMPLYRLFTGLWNYSDRDGRFEWRPRRLKTVILPWWEGDFAAAMDTLAPKFIVRYEFEGRSYGWVRTFKKHQVINPKEQQSKLPPPPPSAIAANDNGQSLPEPVPVAPGIAQAAEKLASVTRGSRVGHASARVESGPATVGAAEITRAAPTPADTGGREGKGIGSRTGTGTQTRVRAHEESPPGVTHIRLFDSSVIIGAFSDLRREAGGGSFQQKRTDYDRAQSAVAWALEEDPKEPLAACRVSIKNFLEFSRGDKEGKAGGWPFWAWANDPGRWFTTVAAGDASMGRVGTEQEFTDAAQQNPEWMGDPR